MCNSLSIYVSIYISIYVSIYMYVYLSMYLFNLLSIQDVPDEEMEELVTYTDEDLDDIDSEALQAQIQEANQRLKQKTPNMAAINEYKKKVVY